MTNIAGKAKTTITNASNAPLPSNNPIEDTMGFVDVNDKINPTLDKMEAEINIAKILSSIVFLIAFMAGIF